MRKPLFVVTAALSLSLVAWGPAHAQAPSFHTGSWSGPGPDGGNITITFTTPEHYASCSAAETSDLIYTTGVPATWVLRGAVWVSYITNSGLQEIRRYDINQYGDLSLRVNYPPSCLWPRLDTDLGSIFELHVDVAIEVYDGDPFMGGQKVLWVGNYPGTLGPGQAWNLWCHAPPPCAGGCTPGFWKQPQFFSEWPGPYLPRSPFASVFGVTLRGAPTLLEVLGLNGGGVNALARHAVAALLNSASAQMTFGMTTAQVVAAFQAAYAPGEYEDTKNTFDVLNNLGCTIR